MADQNSKKSLDTIIPDIEDLFRTGYECDPNDVAEFGVRLSTIVSERLGSYGEPRDNHLRMSNLGRPDRQLWYDVRGGASKEALEPHTLLKFLIGDLYESIILFLAKCAGHEVTHEQAECSIDGVVGHIDAVIDGTVVDVKSASTHAFKKFKDGTLSEDDPFGYVEQISGYATAFGTDGAFLAGDKQNGHLALHRVSQEEIAAINIPERIEHIKGVLASDEVPERCYAPKEFGKSGNLSLATGCSYCPFKQYCWSDANNGIGLRTFIYASGPVHFVDVQREPNGPLEVTF